MKITRRYLEAGQLVGTVPNSAYGSGTELTPLFQIALPSQAARGFAVGAFGDGDMSSSPNFGMDEGMLSIFVSFDNIIIPRGTFARFVRSTEQRVLRARKNLMNRKLIAAIVIIIAACVGLYFWAESEKARFDASLPKPPAVEEQQVIDDTVADDTAGDTAGGHWHGDEWHAEPHQDALLNEGMHCADQQDLTGAPVTGTESQGSLTYVLPPGISREDAIRVNEAYKKWHREVWQPAHDEWWELAQQTTKIFSFKNEEFMRKVDNMSDEERAELAAKVQAHGEKSVAAYERLQAIERNQPNFVAEVLGGE